MIPVEWMDKPLKEGLGEEIKNCMLSTPLNQVQAEIKRLSQWADVLEAQNSYLKYSRDSWQTRHDILIKQTKILWTLCVFSWIGIISYLLIKVIGIL